jgi:hypothetical protein
MPGFSIEQAHEWRKAKKTNSPVDPKVDSVLKRLQMMLKKRDHFFFIDDSPTMRQYKPEIEEAFYTLGYISKSIDTNGIELTFASNIKDGKIHYNTNAGPLLEVLKTCRYDQDEGFMEDSLGHLVDDVIIRRLPSGGSERRFSFSSKKPISIFILTDGRWGRDQLAACGVEKPIRKLMNEIMERKLNRTQVMIQFIRFGNDEDGIRHLEYLDDFGKAEGW